MSSIERTSYQRFASGHTLKEHEFEQFDSLTPDELRFIMVNIRHLVPGKVINSDI